MISIIVPIYNAEKYIDACVESLVNQTTKEPLQIILVDDGSTDGTAALLERYAAGQTEVPFRTLTVLKQKHAGQSAARNLGLQHAKGEYIAFVDADDRLAPEWCERHIAAIEGVDYVQSGYMRVKVINREQKEVQETKVPKNRYQFTSPCMRLYRREAVEGMRFTEGMIYEDVIWSVDLWLRNLCCRMIDYTGYYYTLNPASTTSSPHPAEQKHVFAVLCERAKKADLRGKAIIRYTILRLKTHYLLQ